ncbi:MAG: hypothetical protein M3137_10385 [Actinomycetota bacterium]|nr:hypothetical protein [Actinomycetota bacterium]
MSVEVRSIEPSEIPAFGASTGVPFLDPDNDGDVEFWARVVEPTRTWVAVDGGRFVGNPDASAPRHPPAPDGRDAR